MAGATGRTGIRVVRELQALGFSVRATSPHTLHNRDVIIQEPAGMPHQYRVRGTSLICVCMVISPPNPTQRPNKPQERNACTPGARGSARRAQGGQDLPWRGCACGHRLHGREGRAAAYRPFVSFSPPAPVKQADTRSYPLALLSNRTPKPHRILPCLKTASSPHCAPGYSGHHHPGAVRRRGHHLAAGRHEWSADGGQRHWCAREPAAG